MTAVEELRLLTEELLSDLHMHKLDLVEIIHRVHAVNEKLISILGTKI